MTDADVSTRFNPAPTRIEDVLDCDWLTTALGQTFPGVEVSGFDIVETIVTQATKLRLTLRFSANPGGAPASICLKAMLGDNAPALLASGISRVEAMFYREGAAQLSLRLPRCVYSGIDEATGHGLIIMDDVIVAGAHFRSALNPYSPEDAADSLGQLAVLHVTASQDSRLFAAAWVPSFLDRLAESPLIPVEMLQDLLDGPRGDPLPSELRNAQRLQDAVSRFAARVRSGPQCLVHGDAHAGNVYENEAGLALVDWQVLQRGHWAQDVAYHLGAVLTPETRRTHEKELLAGYLRKVEALGGGVIAFDEAWPHYRVSMIYGYYLWAITRKVAPDITCEFVRRLGLAVIDHSSFDLL